MLRPDEDRQLGITFIGVNWLEATLMPRPGADGSGAVYRRSEVSIVTNTP